LNAETERDGERGKQITFFEELTIDKSGEKRFERGDV
jgi:hypothetical protein